MTEFGGTLIGIAEPMVIAVDVGATNTRVAHISDSISNPHIISFPTDRDLEVNARRIGWHAKTLSGGKVIDMVGHGIAGEVSEDGQTIVQAGGLHEYGWTRRNITEITYQAIGTRSLQDVLLINDAESAGYAQREADRHAGLLKGDYAGLIMTISSGVGGAIYDLAGAKNVEPGHISTGKDAVVACGCGKPDCIEAHISGRAIEAEYGIKAENIPHTDGRWTEYKAKLSKVSLIQMNVLRSRGYKLESLSLYGSVALRGPKIVERLNTTGLGVRVQRATYGDDSGLYGAHFAALEQLAKKHKD